MVRVLSVATNDKPDNVDVKGIAQATNLGVEQVRYFALRSEKRPDNSVCVEERIIDSSFRFSALVVELSDIYLSVND